MANEIIVALGGLGIGILSGFFGIGGGTVTVPFLLYLGIGIKQAIALSSMQMVATSLFGSFLHTKNKTYNPKDVLYIGLGGILGAWIGALCVDFLSAQFLSYLFVAIVAFTWLRLFKKTSEACTPQKHHPLLFILIGLCVGIFSGMLGVGGSILLTPILATFLGFSLKKSSAIGLFFVIFTSITSCVTLITLGYLDFQWGTILAFTSMIGVALGIKAQQKIENKKFKRVIVVFYTIVLVLTIKKVFLG